MIVSHKHRFIFLKTRKTGSSSVEVALSAICGPDDVITPLMARDEALRAGQGARNYLIPAKYLPWHIYLARPFLKEKKYKYPDHTRVETVRDHFGAAVFDSYVKVTILRNPWDREVSRFFWDNHFQRRYKNFESYLVERTKRDPLDNFLIHSIDGRNVADVLMRQDRLEEDFTAFVRSLGVDNIPRLPRTKGEYRPREAQDYRTFYDDRTRALVGEIYRREIEEFGFRF